MMSVFVIITTAISFINTTNMTSSGSAKLNRLSYIICYNTGLNTEMIPVTMYFLWYPLHYIWWFYDQVVCGYCLWDNNSILKIFSASQIPFHLGDLKASPISSVTTTVIFLLSSFQWLPHIALAMITTIIHCIKCWTTLFEARPMFWEADICEFSQSVVHDVP